MKTMVPWINSLAQIMQNSGVFSGIFTFKSEQTKKASMKSIGFKSRVGGVQLSIKNTIGSLN